MKREQYEIWIIDYFDGNLSPENEKELMTYLENNPDMMEEFRAFTDIKLTPNDQIQFNDKQEIKKSETLPFGELNQENYGARVIDISEKNCNSAEKNELNKFVAINPHLKEDISNYDLDIKLKPNREIKYSNKEKLKKGRTIKLSTVLKAATAVAAVALILIIAVPGNRSREIRTPLISYISKTTFLENSSENKNLTKIENGVSPRISNYETEAIITPQRESLMAISSLPQKSTQIDQWYQYPYFLAERYNFSQLEEELQLANQIDNKKSKNGFFAIIGSAIGIKNKKNNDPFIWKAANWSINKYNTLTDRDIILSKIERSSSTNITYGIHSENFNFQKNVKKH